MTQPHRPARELTLERACSHVSEGHEEALAGTASMVRDWLLVEQPGAWGQNAVLNSDLPPAVAARLQHGAAELGARLLLIRRPGRYRGLHPRSLYLVHSGADGSWRRRLSFADPMELLDLDLVGVYADPAGRSTEPFYAVCTNGKHDLCCAVAGVPLARAIAALGDVWHCSHVGGDRFAGNLVCFPEGLYYGRVTPAAGPVIIAAHNRGEVVLEHFRGRSCYSFAVQAGEHFIRTERRLTTLAAVRALGRVGDGPVVRCDFELAGAERVSVEVTSRPTPPPRRLTCRGEDANPPTYDVRWL